MAREPVPQGHPSPAIPPDGARDVRVGKTPGIEASMPYTHYTEVMETPKGPGFLDKVIASLKESVPQFEAMFREAIKDVRATVHETFFGHAEHAAEAGTPLNPTTIHVEREIQAATKHVGSVHDSAQELGHANYPLTSDYEATLAAYAARGQGHDHDHSRDR